jgi:hypothetical protein
MDNSSSNSTVRPLRGQADLKDYTIFTIFLKDSKRLYEACACSRREKPGERPNDAIRSLEKALRCGDGMLWIQTARHLERHEISGPHRIANTLIIRGSTQK